MQHLIATLALALPVAVLAATPKTAVLAALIKATTGAGFPSTARP
jgi:hypothetical protein